MEDRERSRLAAALATLMVLAALVGGCGGGSAKAPSDAEAASAAVRGFATAFGTGKGGDACDLLTKDAQAAFLRRVQDLVRTSDCATAMTKVHDEAGSDVTQAFATATVSAVHVSGTTGMATLTASGHSTTVGLVKQGGDWKLTGVPGI